MATDTQSRCFVKCKETLTGFLREELARSQADGFALGLSGGVDSAVVATLCAEVVSPDHLHALYLYDPHNHARSREDAARIAKTLGCVLIEGDITERVRQRGAYAPGIVRLSRFIPALNRLIVRVSRPTYKVLFRETSFSATLLRDDRRLSRGFRGAVHRAVAAAIEQGFNDRHIVRREILEEYAAKRNLLPVGAANKTESMVGWFVQSGIDDLPIEPLLDLFKGEVRALASMLGIPDDIVQQTPTADMFKGVSDELTIGHSYKVLDKALAAIERGEQEPCPGVTRKQFLAIGRLHALSAWKREGEHRFPALS
jgi:NAD+ synthase